MLRFPYSGFAQRATLPRSLAKLGLQTVRRFTSGPRYRQQFVSQKPAFPARLLIYNAGLSKTYGVAVVKTTCFVIFAASCVVVAPYTHSVSKDEPLGKYWRPALIVLLGSGPFLIYAYVTAPFVHSVSLHIPPYARFSRELILRYSKALPRDALVDVVTVRLMPFQRTTTIRVSDLRLLPKRWFRLENMERVGALQRREAQARLWVVRTFGMFTRSRSKFYYDDSAEASRRSRLPGVWENVLEKIRKNKDMRVAGPGLQ